MRSVVLTTSVFVLFCISTDVSQAQAFDRELRDELLVRRERDQAARLECAKGTGDEQIKCLMKTLEEIDKPNTKWLNLIFEKHGFPAVDLVGADGVKAFFLLLQHSGDTALKEKCRPGLEKAFQEKVLSPSEYASFIDRLLTDQKKLQIFGSNFESKDGKLVMSPAEDIKNLDARRKQIGLPPMADYVKMLKEFYKLEVVLEQ